MRKAPREIVIRDAIKRKIPNPCQNCTDRKVGCHVGCKRETEYKAQVDVEYHKAQDVYVTERMLFSDGIKTSERIKRSRGRGNAKKWNQHTGRRKDGM